MRRAYFAIVLVGLTTFGTLGFGAAVASASFPNTNQLDDFATDSSLSGSWITPALGEGLMRLNLPTAHELTGVDGTWDGALWNTSFAAPVEVWATINRAGSQDANLYADVSGGASGTMHPTSAYFADFGGTNSGGSTGEVSLFRVNGSKNNETKLTFVASPYTNLQPGDAIGLSIASNGVLIAWYKPVGGAWSAVVSWRDVTYSTGKIAIEAIPGVSYGFSNFGGGTPSTPVASALTTTSIGSSASRFTVGQRVTYTATVGPVPDGGTVSFVDNLVPIPGCGAQPVNAGKATCPVSYTAPGSHSVSARYTGSPDGAFAGSANTKNAAVVVTQPTTTTLSLSSTAPAVGTSVLYSATVSPAPNGGTVAFTDHGKAIRGCTTQAVIKGVATCKVTYTASGTHAIRASYTGDTLFSRSATPAPRTVTVSLPPRLTVATLRFIVTVFCPSNSGGCRISSGLAIALPGVKSRITLGTVSTKLKARHAGSSAFVVRRSAKATLTSYLRRHRRAHLGVTLRLNIRDGNGSTGTQTFSYTIRNARKLL